MDGWMDGWIDGWMNGWMDRWMDVGMYGCIYGRMDVLFPFSLAFWLSYCALKTGGMCASKQASMPASQLTYLLTHIPPVLNPVSISYRTVPSTIWPIFSKFLIFCRRSHIEPLDEWNNSKIWGKRKILAILYEGNMQCLAYRYRTKYFLSAKSSFIKGNKRAQKNKILFLIDDRSIINN